MVMTRSKRAKRVLRCLSISQHEDEILGPSITPLIRYNLLHNYSRCLQVSIDLADAVDPFPHTIPYNQLPKFLRSQLEAQKITDGSRLWSQIVPLLAFIQGNLRKLDKSSGFPTLFFWYSRENHRSYFFFAFVENKMASKTYTSRELLRLRNAPVGKDLYEQLQQRLQNDAELGEIFRMQIERSLPLINEEPPNKSGDSDDDEPVEERVSRQLDGTDSEWKYRGRTESEQAETQPIPAPTGLAAQKDEGFQRFYKAVVSPTHVRVTAGGRIVPNTRGSSPTARWIRDRVPGDGGSNAPPPPPSRDPPEQAPVASSPGVDGPPPPGFNGPTHVYPGFAPGVINPGVSHLPSAFPIMPWQLGFNIGSAFGISPHVLGQAQSAPVVQNSARSDTQGDAGASENQMPVLLSPPDQFDPSRPFLLNGQWLWPPIYPYGMPGTPGIPHPPMMGHAIAPHRFGMNPMMFAHPPRPVQSEQPQPPNITVSAPNVPNHMAPARPPISSIRPSEITRRQMEMLRGSLRYYEDQLQYNKHQIDEKETERRAQIVRQQIRHFRRNMEVQLAFEEANYPRPDENEDSDSSESESSESDDESTSPVPVVGETGSVHDRDDTSNPTDDASVVRTVNPQPLQGRSANGLGNSSDSNNSAPAFSTNSPSIVHTLRKECDEKLLKSTKSPSVNSTGTLNEEGIGSEPYLLNEDELRARHMYWGKAPHHLQSGLPKFDGKDFYPPSPVRGSSSGTSSTFGNKAESGRKTDMRRAATRESDPFRAPVQHGPKGASTSGRQAQSEHGSGERVPGPGHAESSRPRTLRPSAKSAGNIRILVSSSEGPSTASTSGTSPQSNDNDGNDDDDKNLIFKGRNALARSGTKTHNEIWQSMLRRGTSSANAIQGTVSSMTAQGVLPQYAGHATASLTPAITNTSVSPRSSAARSGNNRETGSANPAAEKQVENRPPGENKLNVHRGSSARTRAAPAI
ncbi:hypothetical protein PT974_02641 [Cladobotryum mycophilum]|uniref:Uncharacterized protein n=1 Tax=Cladobotryum mycophilum TaxID=491253 RepID=A0ABR0SYN6_9HYPO